MINSSTCAKVLEFLVQVLTEIGVAVDNNSSFVISLTYY